MDQDQARPHLVHEIRHALLHVPEIADCQVRLPVHSGIRAAEAGLPDRVAVGVDFSVFCNDLFLNS